MGFLQTIYKWTTDETWLGYYSKYKEWLRASTAGRVADRFIRIVVVTAVFAFVANYTFGGEVFPVLKSSLIAGFGAAFDKLKNVMLNNARDDGFSKT